MGIRFGRLSFQIQNWMQTMNCVWLSIQFSCYSINCVALSRRKQKSILPAVYVKNRYNTSWPLRCHEPNCMSNGEWEALQWRNMKVYLSLDLFIFPKMFTWSMYVCYHFSLRHLSAQQTRLLCLYLRYFFVVPFLTWISNVFREKWEREEAILANDVNRISQ